MYISNKHISIVIPYTRGLSERFKKTCNSLGIQVNSKGRNNIFTFLMAPRDKDNICQKSGAIYQFKCPHMEYPEEYIVESGRTFGDRLQEHLRVPSPIYQHSHSRGHPVNLECFAIVDRESKGVTRTIKEAMYCYDLASYYICF